MSQDPSDAPDTGPIDYLIVEFDSDAMTGEAFPQLVDLVDRGIIRVLDLLVLRKEDDGTVTGIELDEFADGSTGLEIFSGATSGLLGHEDLAEAAEAVEPGKTAAVLVYENVWAAGFASALRRGGAQLVASGRIPVQAVLAALDAAENAS
jgi:hypothetical protein